MFWIKVLSLYRSDFSGTLSPDKHSAILPTAEFSNVEATLPKFSHALATRLLVGDSRFITLSCMVGFSLAYGCKETHTWFTGTFK